MRALWTASFCIALTSCNSTSFNGAAARQPAAAKPAPGSANDTPAVATGSSEKTLVDGASSTETFLIAQNQGMIDMVWVIDNSGSMNEEAAQVRKSFEQFVGTVQSRADMKIALLSKTVEGETAASGGHGHTLHSTGVTMPAALASKGLQVDSWVGSNDPLTLLAMAICAANSTVIPTDGSTTPADPFGALTSSVKACGKDVPVDNFEIGQAPEAPGKLHDFFRPQAKKVFVIVSDDNAEGVDATNFLDLVKADIGAQDPAIFGFVGLSETRPGCSISQVGTAYKDLSAKTGGAVFDICDADWTANFGKLSDNVLSIAQSQFTVSATRVAAVVSATIDGKAVPAASIQVKGSVVTVDPAAIPGGAKSIVITYKRGA